MRIRREGESRRAAGSRGERMNAPKRRSGGVRGPALGGAGGGLGNLGKGGGVAGILIALVVAFLAMRGGGGTTSTTGDGDVVGQRTQLVDVDKTTRSTLSGAERDDLDRFLQATVDDLLVFWTDEYPDVYGARFEPLSAIFPFDPTGNQQISCGQPLDPRILNSNAIYCPPEDYITWDDNFLIPNFYANFGKAAVGVVLAHEYGHAVQTRGGLDAAPIIRDLQADCFAGAWIRRAIDGSGQVELGENDLEGAVSGFLLLRDPPGNPTDSQSAHGSAFDRVNAFQSGYTDGAARCRDFATEGVEIVDIALEQGDVGGGNLAFQDAVDAVVADLDEFWQPFFAQAGLGSGISARWFEGSAIPCPDSGSDGQVFHYCASDASVQLNQATLARLHADIGDFSTGLHLARLYGEAAATEAGVADRTGLVADCLAGVWAGNVAYESTRALELTGGDLDEALATLIDDPERADAASLFDRVDAFKRGFFLEGGSGTAASVEFCS
ncbi:MAG: neutral zinc metallopeptidase [Acidimicrobiales bacterium]